MKRNEKVMTGIVAVPILFLLAVCVLWYSAADLGPPSGYLP
jgi:hypothetical protein